MANAKPTYGQLAAINVTLDGVTKTVAEWAVERGLELRLVYERNRFGDSYERALRPKRTPRLIKEKLNAPPPVSDAKQRALTSGFAEAFTAPDSKPSKYGSMPHRFE